MLIVRVAGFIFAIYTLISTDKVCDCANDIITEDILDDDNILTRQTKSACPTFDREWYMCARLLIFTMACDVLFPPITLVVVLRKRIYKCYRRLRPARGRELEDQQRAWQLRCKRESIFLFFPDQTNHFIVVVDISIVLPKITMRRQVAANALHY